LKSRVSKSLLAFVVVASQAGGAVHAFTLGEVRGAAVVGRPLDVTVLLQSAEAEEVSSACIQVEIQYGDVPQLSPRVSVSPGSQSGQSLARLQSRTAVDEPVVNLLVRATCGSTTQRTYVLLADFPALSQLEPVVAPLPLPSPQAAALSGAAAARVAGSSDGKVTAPTGAPPAKSANQKVAKVPSAGRSKADDKSPDAGKAKGAKSKVVPAKPGKSVLKLDPLELLSDRVDRLDSFMDFSPEQDALRYAKQVESLESEMKTLQAKSASNEAKLMELRGKLEQAQQSALPQVVLIGLGAGLLLCLVAVAWLWRDRMRTRAAPDWWQPAAAAAQATAPAPLHDTQAGVADELAPAVVAETPAEAVVLAGLAKSAVSSQAVPAAVYMPDASGLDIDLDLAFSSPMPFDGMDKLVDHQPHQAHSIRHIGLDPILDIRQQVEFFVSLGQTDRAMMILRKQIAGASEPNPLLHLDLLSLYQSLGLIVEFEEQREVFQRLFNTEVPLFAAFNTPTADLEAYPLVLAELMRLWPKLEVLGFLEHCIFLDVKQLLSERFSLAAFRDLLALHALADAVVDHATPAYQSTLGMLFDSDGVLLDEHPATEASAPPSLDLDISEFRARRQTPL